jgi:hypothetical protein
MKLAAFYTIKDKMYPGEPAKTEPAYYSRASGPVSKADGANDTEFSRVIAGIDATDLVPVMDELMSTLQVVSPRIYAGVMRKLSEL